MAQTIDPIFELMVRQREELFAQLSGVPNDRLWLRPGPGEWSIGENVDHLRAVYLSFLPWLQAAWTLLHPLARLRRAKPYRTQIDNVYRRPNFPQKVGWLFPSRYTPDRPAALDVLYAGVCQAHARAMAFYAGKDADVLGHVVLWDPAIGAVNLIQALRVAIYHDEVHIESIRQMMTASRD
jgi:hypothetical protein